MRYGNGFVPEGLGLATIFHDVPSHCSTSVRGVTGPFPAEPTAKHSVGVAHEIPKNPLPVPATLGVDITDHTLPSQCSTNVCCG